MVLCFRIGQGAVCRLSLGLTGPAPATPLAVWVLERIYDLLAVILVFGFALTRVKPKAQMSPALEWILNTGGYFVATIGIVCVTVLIALSVFTEPATRRIRDALSALPEKFRHRADGLVTAFVGGMASARRGSYVISAPVSFFTVSVLACASLATTEAYSPARTPNCLLPLLKRIESPRS